MTTTLAGLVKLLSQRSAYRQTAYPVRSLGTLFAKIELNGLPL